MNFEDEFDVVPPEGNVFVNHEINGRSGHLGHALVEYEEGKILAFTLIAHLMKRDILR